MTKIPKKIPSWLQSFAAFAKSKEKKKDIRDSIDIFSQVLNTRWVEFVEQCHQENKSAPSKPRKVDPIKNMGKAMEKVSSVIEDAQDNSVLMDQIKDRMKESMPESIKPMLSEIIGPTGDTEMSGSSYSGDQKQISPLLHETSRGLQELLQVNQEVSNNIDETGVATIKEADIDNTTKLLNQVAHNVTQLQKVLL